MVVHVSFTTVTKVGFRIHMINVTLVTREKTVVQFEFTKRCRFCLGTLVSFNSNSEPIRGDPY